MNNFVIVKIKSLNRKLELKEINQLKIIFYH